MTVSSGSLLGAAQLREIAAELGVRPTKKLGQNFVHDANTVRKIVRLAEVRGDDRVLEVGPGLGSLTLALTETGAEVTAVEIDPVLAGALPATVQRLQPDAQLTTVCADATRLTADDVPWSPSVFAANLPYNVAVPILLRVLSQLPSLRRGVVMVQHEVAERLAAAPGSKVYGAPTVKAAWYGAFSLVSKVSRQVFWPVPGVDSALVGFLAHPRPLGAVEERWLTFALIDAAFASRRKMLRQTLRVGIAHAVAGFEVVSAGKAGTVSAADKAGTVSAADKAGTVSAASETSLASEAGDPHANPHAHPHANPGTLGRRAHALLTHGDSLKAVLKSAGVHETARAEALETSDFLRIAREIMRAIDA